MILRALPVVLSIAALATAAQARQPTAPSGNGAFDRFLTELRKDAQAQGITRATFSLAFAGIAPDPRVIATTKRQPEYNKPAGAPGPAFVVTANFDVIKRYNDSDVYALAVGHLADRMQGRAPLRTAWPKGAMQLARDDRIALQRKLAELGYDQKQLSAHIDFKMRDFVRAEQKKHGLVPDGHPTAVLLDRMGVKRQ